MTSLPSNAKIVAFGDSITRGYDATGAPLATYYNGWRDTVDTAAIAAGWTGLQWVGTQNNSTASYVPTRLHEGINGDNCWSKLPGHGSTNGSGYTTSPIDTIFGAGMPLHGADVIIVALGTNAEDSGTFGPNYLDMMRRLRVLEPQARYVVARVNNVGAVSLANDTSLSAAGGLWDQLTSEGFTLFRTAAMSGITLSGDAIHPNGAGYVTMGGIIGPAVVSALRGR